jgi:tripartite-type tricarboxylate transporter receptor subunit TctC
MAQLASVPTIAEEGVDVTFTMWRSVLAPKGTPPAVVEKLEGVFRQITVDPSFQALIKQLGDDIQFQGAKDFESTWRQETESFAKVVVGVPK